MSTPHSPKQDKPQEVIDDDATYDDSEIDSALRERYQRIKTEESEIDPAELTKRLRDSAQYWDEELSE